jgi:hypothetical protein
MSRPCSSHVYQLTPTPAKSATSSRRSPGVRRRVPLGSPTLLGARRERRTRRNEASSERFEAASMTGPMVAPTTSVRSKSSRDSTGFARPRETCEWTLATQRPGPSSTSSSNSPTSVPTSTGWRSPLRARSDPGAYAPTLSSLAKSGNAGSFERARTGAMISFIRRNDGRSEMRAW